MSEATFFWTWVIVALVGLVSVHSYATYNEVLRGERDEDLRFMGSALSAIWPLTIVIGFTVGIFGFAFYWGPRLALDALVVQPRLRRVAREAEAKTRADAARYEVERGTHR